MRRTPSSTRRSPLPAHPCVLRRLDRLRRRRVGVHGPSRQEASTGRSAASASCAGRARADRSTRAARCPRAAAGENVRGRPSRGASPTTCTPGLLVPAAEMPDRRPLYVEAVRQVLHDGRRVRHGQQDPCAACDTLLRASITEQLLEVARVVGRQIERTRRSPSHPRGVALRRDYVEKLIERSTSIVLTANAIKLHLGLDLGPEELRLEQGWRARGGTVATCRSRAGSPC
jgi:hypothetical protein